MTVQGGFSEEFSDEFETDETYYVTLDERVYDVASGATRGEFSNDYSSDFTVPPIENLPPWGRIDRTQRPEHPLWRRVLYPVTPVGLLLYTDGTVKATTTFEIDEWLEADDRILGGHVWYARNDSWQAQVLEAAGYPLRRYEGPIL